MKAASRRSRVRAGTWGRAPVYEERRARQAKTRQDERAEARKRKRVRKKEKKKKEEEKKRQANANEAKTRKTRSDQLAKHTGPEAGPVIGDADVPQPTASRSASP